MKRCTDRRTERRNKVITITLSYRRALTSLSSLFDALRDMITALTSPYGMEI